MIVSSFVLPHAGGVEQFVDTASTLLAERGWAVRVLACRPREGTAAADVTMPTRFLPPGGWPVPVGGWRALWREIGRADAVVANGSRHLLPNIAALAARLRGRRAIFVLHGSGAPFTTSSLVYHRLLGSGFEWLVVRVALRLSLPISLSRAGVGGARRRYGVEAAHVPYPLRELPPAPGSFPPARTSRSGSCGSAGCTGRRTRCSRSKPSSACAAGVTRPSTSTAAGSSGTSSGGSRGTGRGSCSAAREAGSEIQEAQAAGHVCLSTSLRDATQIAILEPLARGIPVVSTRVGDAPAHYVSASLQSFCVDAADPDATAAAILDARVLVLAPPGGVRRKRGPAARPPRARRRNG